MTPLTRLSDLAGASLDAIGAALADIPRFVNHQSHRIAVTKLQRAGKTVFVTSFTHALLHAANAPPDAFPFFPWRGQVQDVAVENIPGIPRFPYRERLDDLLADNPKWPDRTIGLTVFESASTTRRPLTSPEGYSRRRRSILT
jgi:predicted YcjX-like family ATPase